nr:sodium/proton-translocating pyrophosphatase [Eubacterium sp.]
MNSIIIIVPILAVVALIFALIMANSVKKEEVGTDRMKEISEAIREGAGAFLTSEYKILIIFVAVLFVILGVALGNWTEAVCFVIGAVFSSLAGFFGMRVATLANVRTANAARTGGMPKALAVAYHGGA